MNNALKKVLREHFNITDITRQATKNGFNTPDYYEHLHLLYCKEPISLDDSKNQLPTAIEEPLVYDISNIFIIKPTREKSIAPIEFTKIKIELEQKNERLLKIKEIAKAKKLKWKANQKLKKLNMIIANDDIVEKPITSIKYNDTPIEQDYDDDEKDGSICSNNSFDDVEEAIDDSNNQLPTVIEKEVVVVVEDAIGDILPTAIEEEPVYELCSPVIYFSKELYKIDVKRYVIYNMLKQLYVDSKIYKNFLRDNGYNKIKVIKDLHYGYRKDKEPIHFNIIFKNTRYMTESKPHHIYVVDKKIVSMSKVDVVQTTFIE